MPSFFIFDWRVVRFIASRAPAPSAPPTTPPPRGGKGRALEGVLQLPDGARPEVLHHDIHGLGGNGLDPAAHAPGDLLREMADESGNVLAALAQGGQHDGKHVEAVIEVVAE